MIGRSRAGRPERQVVKGSPFAEFASRLLALRRAAGLSVRELADLTGYSPASISAAVSGKSLPSLRLTLAFVAACRDNLRDRDSDGSAARALSEAAQDVEQGSLEAADPAAWEKLWWECAAARRTPDTGNGVPPVERDVPTAKRGVPPAEGRVPSGEGPQAADSVASDAEAIAAILAAAENARPPADDRRIPGADFPLQENGSDPFQSAGWLTDETSPIIGRRPELATGSVAAVSHGLAGFISTATGQGVSILPGHELIFGRGPEVDLAIAAGRGLSRRAGVVTMVAAGALIRNISRTHALYVEGDGYRIRLPRLEDDGTSVAGWFVCAGTALVGSRSMLDDGQPLTITVRGGPEGWSSPAVPGGSTRSDGSDRFAQDDDGTLLPLYLDPMTKLFLVALIWCRPWLLDASATTPLLRTPEIAHAILEVTGAFHELERFETDPEYRDRMSARIAEHLKVLRRKINDRGLAGPDVRLSDEVAVRILIEHGIITSADLGRLSDPAWCSRQEDLWWVQQ